MTVICTDDSLEFGKAYEDLLWNRCTSTPHRQDLLARGEEHNDVL